MTLWAVFVLCHRARTSPFFLLFTISVTFVWFFFARFPPDFNFLFKVFFESGLSARQTLHWIALKKRKYFFRNAVHCAALFYSTQPLYFNIYFFCLLLMSNITKKVSKSTNVWPFLHIQFNDRFERQSKLYFLQNNKLKEMMMKYLRLHLFMWNECRRCRLHFWRELGNFHLFSVFAQTFFFQVCLIKTSSNCQILCLQLTTWEFLHNFF